MEPGYNGGEGKESDEDEFLLRLSPLQPWRHDRDDDVEADERVHEP